jgi:hypothetical protein
MERQLRGVSPAGKSWQLVPKNQLARRGPDEARRILDLAIAARSTLFLNHSSSELEQRNPGILA